VGTRRARSPAVPWPLPELQVRTGAAAKDRVEMKHRPRVQTVLQQEGAGFCRADPGEPWLAGHQTPLRSQPQHLCHTRDAESRTHDTCLSCTRYLTWQCPLRMLCAPAEPGQLHVLQHTTELLQNGDHTCTAGRRNSAYCALSR